MLEVKHAIASKKLPPATTRRALRLAAGLSLEDIATVVGVTRSAVSRWERGTRQPRGTNRSRYADVLAQLRGVIADGD
jgi:transcriptional regulator with XRE-family HTH domain